MDEYDDLDTYNSDAVHDMWVDYNYHENTGKLPYVEEETDLDNYIENLNDRD